MALSPKTEAALDDLESNSRELGFVRGLATAAELVAAAGQIGLSMQIAILTMRPELAHLDAESRKIATRLAKQSGAAA